LLGGDCNDSDSLVNPGAVEVLDGVDNDCNGIVDDGTDAYDADGDGYTVLGGDCDDSDPDARPGGTEVLNGNDDDCDGIVDEGTFIFDDDGDGLSEADGDCNDGDPTMFPLNVEVQGCPPVDPTCDCDGVDNDCVGTVDEGTQCYDDDGDGYTEEGADCDDGNPSAYPNNPTPALGNGADDDCDGVVE
jgi:hypothetical protein